MFKLHYLTALILGLSLSLSAQSDLVSDTTYFRQQATVYQQWLTDSGLGTTLRVHIVQVKGNALNLFLGFHNEDSNHCHAAWAQLQKDFAARKGLTLEQTLYYKMIQLMETPQELSRVLIYDTYDRSKKYNFEVKIHFDSAQVKVDFLNWKSEFRHIEIMPHQLDKLKKPSLLQLQGTYNKERVFEAVHTYLKKRYENQPTCDQRDPKVDVLEKVPVLRLRVDDLCKEVLSTARNCMVCPMLNLNWIKRERLTFTFTYAQEVNSFSLSMEVDGQYGSGVFSVVGRNGYKPMDTAFKDDLEDYANKLRLEIQQVLIKLDKP